MLPRLSPASFRGLVGVDSLELTPRYDNAGSDRTRTCDLLHSYNSIGRGTSAGPDPLTISSTVAPMQEVVAGKNAGALPLSYTPHIYIILKEQRAAMNLTFAIGVSRTAARSNT